MSVLVLGERLFKPRPPVSVCWDFTGAHGGGGRAVQDAVLLCCAVDSSR